MKQQFQTFLNELNNDSLDRKISDYRREKEVLKEYNGRQLLELLQNIDDQKSEKALIKLDTTNKILVIANKGKPFSEGGLKSLMMANLSSKDVTFIGNKGLGFRSLLNWAGEIYVKSSDTLSIEFSEKNRNELQKDKQRAILSSPKWISSNNKPTWINQIDIPKEYITYVAINYPKDVEKYILNQINEISEELMFFIDNIKMISIENDKKITIFERKNWNIIHNSAELPEEIQEDEDSKESYRLSVILPPKNQNINPYLFSYFPTNIKHGFPALIHATFDLDSSRNNIVDNKKNRFVIKKLAKFMIEIAKSLKKEISNWDTYEFLDIKNNNKNELLEKFNFYEIIEKWKESAEIYPCINNKYCSLEKFQFYNNKFSIFMKKHSDILPNLLKNNSHVKENYRRINNFNSIINEISKEIKTISERIEFLKIILFENMIEMDNFRRNCYKGNLNVLVNQYNSLKNDLFFYSNQFISLKVPEFIEINYIHPELQSHFEKLDFSKLNVKEFDIFEDLIDKIILSNQNINIKLKNLYDIYLNNQLLQKPKSKLIEISNKLLRKEVILKIFNEDDIIQDYKELGIEKFKKLDSFLIWLGAKKKNESDILKKVIEQNNSQYYIQSSLSNLIYLKEKLSNDSLKIIKGQDIYVFDANLKIKKIRDLFSNNDLCEEENMIAHKNDLGLENYSDYQVKVFFEWLDIKEINLNNLTLKRLEFLRDKNLSDKRTIKFLKFLYESKMSGHIDSSIKPEKIYIFGELAENLYFRTPMTTKYCKYKLLSNYSDIGFEDSNEVENFFKWIGVKNASNRVIIDNIFKSGNSINIKLKDLNEIYSKNKNINPPEIDFLLKSKDGKSYKAKTLYFNDNFSKFLNPKKIIDHIEEKIDFDLLEWLGVSTPSNKYKAQVLVKHLINPKFDSISLDMRKEAIQILSEIYCTLNEGTEAEVNRNFYLINDNNIIRKSCELFQRSKFSIKHIPDEIIHEDINLNLEFLSWLGVKEADNLKIIESLLNQKNPNLEAIFEIWKDGKIRRTEKLETSVKILLKNRKNKQRSSSDLFLEKQETKFYTDNEIITNFKELNLEKFKKEDVERFLIWLGVNEYIKIDNFWC